MPWNESDKSASLTLSVEDIRVTQTANDGSYRAVRSGTVMAQNDGKKYGEILLTNIVTTPNPIHGLSSSASSLSDHVGAHADSYGVLPWGGGGASRIYNNDAFVIKGGAINEGSVLMFAWDSDAGELWFGVDESWIAFNAGANPATGTNPTFSGITADLYFSASCREIGDAVELFDNENLGVYDPPTGFDWVEEPPVNPPDPLQPGDFDFREFIPRDPDATFTTLATRFSYRETTSRGNNDGLAAKSWSYLPWTVSEGEDLEWTFETQLYRHRSSSSLPIMLAFSGGIDSFDNLSTSNFWCLRSTSGPTGFDPTKPPRYTLETYYVPGGGVVYDEDFDDGTNLISGMNPPTVFDSTGVVYFVKMTLSANGGVNSTGLWTMIFHDDESMSNPIHTLEVNAPPGVTLASFVEYLWIFNMWNIGGNQNPPFAWATGYIANLNDANDEGDQDEEDEARENQTLEDNTRDTTTGNIWHLEDRQMIKDDTANIAWEAQSKEFTLQTRRHFPRWAKYDIESKDAESVTGQILLDRTVHQSHPITAAQSRKKKRRLIEPGNGKKSSIRINGSGPARVFLAEME